MNRNKFVKGLSLFLVLATMLCMLTVVSLADAGSFSGDSDYGGWDSGSDYSSSDWSSSDWSSSSSDSSYSSSGDGDTGGVGCGVGLVVVIIVIIVSSLNGKNKKGGGGSCGMCKCQVLEGGGDILPTETGFISRKLAKDHWRLGCQVKVKENMKIRVPEAVLGVKKWECTVVSNRNISTFLKEFVVKLPEGENLKFRSGGYIQIDIPKYDAIKFSSMDVDEKFRADWDKFKMWDLVTTNPEPTFRAYSMANHPAEGNIIMLNIRIATPPFDRVNGGFMKVNPASSSCRTTCPIRRSWSSSAAVPVWRRCAATSCTCSRPRRRNVPCRSGTAPVR